MGSIGCVWCLSENSKWVFMGYKKTTQKHLSFIHFSMVRIIEVLSGFKMLSDYSIKIDFMRVHPGVLATGQQVWVTPPER